MAAPPQPPSIPNLAYTKLSQELQCPIAYSLSTLSQQDGGDGAILILFVNGLGLPQAFWQPAITLLKSDPLFSSSTHRGRIYAATYDRYGQGLSKPEDGAPPASHTLEYSAVELEMMRSFIISKTPENKDPRLFLVAHSIGVPLARLYCQQNPGKVSAALFLDSNLANSDFVSILPDPDSASFKADNLPADTTVEQLRQARAFAARMFHPSAPNAEGLDRSNIPSLLPAADSPKLTPPAGEDLQLTIVGHDTDAFAEESLKMMPKGLTTGFVEPAWRAYNESLLQLVPSGKGQARGVISAPKSGHFIQRDNPRFVADQIVDLLKRMA